MGALLAVDVWSDLVCPWCYLGKRRLERALRERPGIPVVVRWQPFELNPGMPAAGADRREYLRAKFGDPRRLEAAQDQLVALGREAGIDYRFDLIRRVPNTRVAHALIALAGERQGAVVEALFRAYFGEARDIGDLDVLIDIGAGAGLAVADLAAQLTSREAVASVEAGEGDAARLGISGVPFFVLAGRWALSGAQESATIAAALDQVAAAIGSEPVPIAADGRVG
jgi:predicted DsbA family dithiol-disulfide isomerase